MTFTDLVASRKEWIENTLKPWCQTASASELVIADDQWLDLAGRAEPLATLWTWAWGRFPDLIHDGLIGIDETHEVEVTLHDGSKTVGYPDASQSRQGHLALVQTSGSPNRESDSLSIDEIDSVRRID